MLAYFVSAVLFGFVIGALARWAVPGPDPMPAWLTIFIGLSGSLIGGGIVVALVGTGSRGDLYLSVMASIGVAAVLVIAYRRFIQDRPVTGPEAQRLPTRGFGIPRLRQRLERMGVDPDSIGQPGGPRPTAAVRSEHDEDLQRIENLRKLEDLHEAGLLTDDEFQAKRAELLERR
ncbi:MAG TPA: SHOCT domain-containing protein [Gaiellaceae bacterium]|nr:SHOCT domain-containing protein [Gaiellaceae bacterium]